MPTFRIAGRSIAEPSLPSKLQERSRGTGAGVVDPFLPPGYVRPVAAVDVSDATRSTAGGQEQQQVPGEPGQVIALELADGTGTTIYTSPENLADVVRRVAPNAIDTDGTINLERLNIRGGEATRDVVGMAGRVFSRVSTLQVGGASDVIIDEARKQLEKWLGGKAVDAASLGVSWLGTKALMWAIESRLSRKPGLYRWLAADGEPTDLFSVNDVRLEDEARQGPMLVFIHGTASSTVGSYSDLQKASRDYWKAFTDKYGDRIYAFEHRTMSESPIENALQLARALPKGARLHLVTHSRGGLVGDLLCLDSLASADKSLIQEYKVDDVAIGETPNADRKRVRGELEDSYADHRTQLQDLAVVLRQKQFTIERYVRVAAPTRGTRLISGNLDVFLSGLLTLIGLVPALAGQPIYSAFKRVVLEIAKHRTRPNLVPGIEAMLPESPMTRLLARATPSAGTEIAVIAGDIQGGGLLKRLGVLFTDHVFFNGGDNDLVVDTDSMYGGIARPGRAHALFDQGADVSHFRYFANSDTRKALSRWLLEKNLASVDDFLPLGADGPEARFEPARARVSRGVDATVPMPVVVVLPGIMGSHLWVGKKRRVWLAFADLVSGGIKEIAFDKPNVDAERIYDPSYADLCSYLTKSHQVEPFPYDWRQPVDVLADRLADRLRLILKLTADTKQPVRFLAHSMGGLVVRALAHKYSKLWDDVMTHDGARFIMLGTPNRGSHSMVENLIGKGDNVRKLAVVDLAHDLKKVLGIIGEFPGALQLLPSPTLPDAGGDTATYYDSNRWKTLQREMLDPWFGKGAVATPSDGALDLGNWLWKADKKNPSSLIPFKDKITYVHGVAPNTAAGLKKVNGQWKMVAVRDGDGTVTWESGCIDGIVNRLYMPAEHGALADTSEYFASLESLLLNNDPGLLMKSAPTSRAVQADSVEYDAGPPVYPSESQLGVELVGRRTRKSMRARALPTLTVRVRAGDLRDSTKPILVGHYEQDTIAAAEALIDSEVVEGGLTIRYNLGMYAGALGTATVVLKTRNQAEIARNSYRGAVVTGLGKYDGTLGANALTEAVRTAALRFLLHIYDATDGQEGPVISSVPLASLLLGYNSSANLSIEDSVGAILRGVIDANRKFRESFQSPLAIDDLEIIELYADTAISTGYALRKVASALNSDPNIGCRVEAAAEILAMESMRYRLEDSRGGSYWPRLHIIEDDNCKDERKSKGLPPRLKFLYVGQRARAETISTQQQPGVVDRLVEAQIRIRAYNEDFSRSLFQLLVPNEFKDPARQVGQAVLVLDDSTANVPWEIMLADKKPLAVSTALVRQLSSTEFRLAVREATERRAYVIGNPKVEGFADAFKQTAEPPSLDAAEREAKAVVDVLSQHGFDVVNAIGQGEPALGILNRLYRYSYRLLHIAAHGVFEQEHKDGVKRTGVVLSDGLLITAAEVRAMEVIPELVFLNCCHLGKTNPGADETQLRTKFNRLAYSISRELIDMGVRVVVAAGWAVDDEPARLFAETFYRKLLEENAPFGEAVYTARCRVWDVYPTSITWGAYQAYGDPMWRMEPPRDGGDTRVRTTNWNPVAPDELIARIEQQRVDLRRRKSVLDVADAKRIAGGIEGLLNARPNWLNRPDVLYALGALYADMGKEYFQTAVDYYQRAISEFDEPGDARMLAVREMANLEARGGEYRDNVELIESAIRRFKLLGALGQPKTTADAEALEPAAVRTKLDALLGSAYKRLAAVHARQVVNAKGKADHAGPLTEMNKALGSSLKWYGGPIESPQAERQKGKKGTRGYTTTNRIFLRLLENPTPDEKKNAMALAQECRQIAETDLGLDGNYWSAVVSADAFLAAALLDGKFDQQESSELEKVVKQYADASTGILVGRKSLDSTVQNICLMALFMSAKAKDTDDLDWRKRLLSMAKALGEVAERLSPGACGGAGPSVKPEKPEPGPGTPPNATATRPKGPAPSSPRRPRKKAVSKRPKKRR